jgi:hypothetical protein
VVPAHAEPRVWFGNRIQSLPHEKRVCYHYTICPLLNVMWSNDTPGQDRAGDLHRVRMKS